MTRCPYCRMIANPVRLLLYSPALGYPCKKCGGRSRLTRWGFIPMALVLLATIILGDFVLQERWVWICVGAVAAWLVMWLFLRLNPMKGGDPETPTTAPEA